jgi:peptidoglycan DL-endopeptidase CwlO
MSGSVRSGAEAPKVRRDWLALAAVAAALSVPLTALSPAAHAASGANGASGATPGGQQKAGAPAVPTGTKAPATKAPAKKPKVHKAAAPKKTFDQKAAALAKTLVGDPYVYAGTSPAGFDCSGLTQYVYRHTGRGMSIQRIAEDQFLEFRRISHARARPGDLVFFHVDSDPDSYVYHVGVYEGGDMMVAATTYGEGVQYQNFTWAGDTVTFGTITH